MAFVRPTTSGQTRRVFLGGALAGVASLSAQDLLTPAIVGDWWSVAGNPDLGRYTTPVQEPVDFAVWQAVDGTWQLWSCIRKTAVPGATRLFYRWEGRSLTDPDWEPKGIAMMADPNLGETAGSMQAPFVLNIDGVWHMFYSSGGQFALALSWDGKSFARQVNASGKVDLFGKATDSSGWGGRDIIVHRIGNLWHAYYTSSPDRSAGRVFVRTSTDLKAWSAPREVASGGEAGDLAWSAECPWVYELPGSGWFYLFRTQNYKGKPITRVYRSRDPYDFGIGHDRYLVSRMPVAAPEIVEYQGELFIAALRPELDGIRIARLTFAR